MLKSGVSSNKDVAGQIVAHANEPQPIETGLYPLLDKISICIPITDQDERKEILGQLWDVANLAPLGVMQAHGGSSSYRTRLRFHFRDGPHAYRHDHVRVEADPYIPKRPFLRFEWNPSKAGAEGQAEIREILSQLLPGGPARLIGEGKVSRLDVAVDLPGITPDDLIVEALRRRKRHIYIGPDGYIETLYLGSSRSNQVTVYDRAQQSKMQSIAPPDVPTTRIEVRLKQPGSFLKLPDIPNPFEKVKVFGPFNIDFETAPALHSVIESSRLRGLRHALRRVPPKLRKQYRSSIEATALSSWKPDEIWSRWPQVLNALELHPSVFSVDPFQPAPSLVSQGENQTSIQI